MNFRLFLVGLLALCAQLAPAQPVNDLSLGKVQSAAAQPDFNPDPFSKSRMQARDRAEERRDSAAYNDCLTQAFNLLAVDSLSQAQVYLERALQLRPRAQSTPVVRYNLGLIFQARQQYADAIRTFTQCLADRPDYAEARFQRANSYFRAQQYSAAIADAQQLTGANSPLDKAGQSALYSLLWMSHRNLKQDTQALAAAEQSLQLAPNDSLAALRQSISLRDLRRFDEARLMLDRTVDRHPNFVSALVLRAELFSYLGLFDLAREDYDRAIALEPNDVPLRLARAEVLIELRLPRAAKQDLDAARQLGAPNSELKKLYDKL